MSEKFRKINFGSDSDEHFSEAETVTITSESETEEEEGSTKKETGTQVTYRDLPRKKRSSNTGTVRRIITRAQSRNQGLDSSQLDDGAGEFVAENQIENEQENHEEDNQREGNHSDTEQNENEELLNETEVCDLQNEELLRDTEVCDLPEENLPSTIDAASNSIQSISLTESVATETSQREKNDLTVNISGTLEDGTTVQPVSIHIERDSDVGTINIRLGSLSVQRSDPAETLVVPSTSFQSFNVSSLPKMDDTKLSSSTVKKKDHLKSRKISSKEKKKKDSKKKGRKHRSRRSSTSSFTSSTSYSSSDYDGRCYYRVGDRYSSDSSSEYSTSTYSSSEEECTCRKSKAKKDKKK